MRIRESDQQLLQIVDQGFADSAERSGKWLACQPGCSQCCFGAFAITPLDAARLQWGLAELRQSNPARADALARRVQSYLERTACTFPGDLATGWLSRDEASLSAFEAFANDEPCPVLDPQSGRCDLYDSRPITCRLFGAPLQVEGGLSTCELCFVGAPAEAVQRGELRVDTASSEEALSAAVTGTEAGAAQETIVALALWSACNSDRGDIAGVIPLARLGASHVHDADCKSRLSGGLPAAPA